ncbi:MAG: Gfo/Idh/MocA family oxidoreductase [Chloroflexota bacterium]
MVKIGLIGYGYWGPKHARNFHELPGAEFRMVADLNGERLRQVQAMYPWVACTKDYRELLESDVEGVVIATPVSTHHQIAREALLRGKHVLVEKPMTSSLQEARELVEIADSQQRILMVGHTYQYNPAVAFLRDYIKSGELGEIYYIDANRLNLGLFQPDVSALWDLAPHDLSILLWLLGENPLTISARGAARITPPFHDVVYVEMMFPGNIMAHIHVSWLDPCKMRRVTVVGSKKMVVFDDMAEAEKIRIYDKGVVPMAEDNGNGWPVHYHNGNVVIPSIPNTEPLKVECQHFLDCITRGQQPVSDGRMGLRVVNILEAAARSLCNGGERQSLSEEGLLPLPARRGAR